MQCFEVIFNQTKKSELSLEKKKAYRIFLGELPQNAAVLKMEYFELLT